MGKRLTVKEKENREIQRIVKKIINLEKHHEQRLVESACYKYKNANLDKRTAEKEIKDLNERLETAKSKLK